MLVRPEAAVFLKCLCGFFGRYFNIKRWLGGKDIPVTFVLRLVRGTNGEAISRVLFPDFSYRVATCTILI